MKYNIKQPLYLKLADELRLGIIDKKWQAGDLLPSETQLCLDYGVSRGTVVRALDVLLKEGLAQRRQGVGTFVARPALHRQPGFLVGFSETVLSQGRVPSQRLLAMRQMSRSDALQYGCDEPVVVLDRVRLVDGVPWAIHKSLIPLSVARKMPVLGEGAEADRQAPDFSLYRAFGDAGYIIDHAEEAVQSRLAGADEAALLEVELPAAVMMVHRKSFDPNDRLLELIEAIYLGESYTYDAKLVRKHSITDIHAQS